MPVENGNTTNGVGPSRIGSDEFDDVTSAAVRVEVVDETSSPDVTPSHNGRRESEGENGGGVDNPAFHGDEPSANGSSQRRPAADNGVSNGQRQSQPDAAGKGDMEMASLNPNVAPTVAPPSHKKTGGKNAAATNGSAPAANTNTKDQNKTALDTMYNDYFRPVNTRRKLLRGEKLYVMKDQRNSSRGWKWIAFWGGVFTFVAAALLAGILAATGVIMSKSESSPSSSNSLVANLSDISANATTLESFDVTPFPDDMIHMMPGEETKENNTEHSFIPNAVPTEELFPNTDFGNSLDSGFPTSHDGDVIHVAVPDDISINNTMTPSTTSMPIHPTIMITSNERDELVPSVLEVTTPGRARSLDKEAPFLGDTENATLFTPIVDPAFPDNLDFDDTHNGSDTANSSVATFGMTSEDSIGVTSTPLPNEETNEESSMNFGIVPTNATSVHSIETIPTTSLRNETTHDNDTTAPASHFDTSAPIDVTSSTTLLFVPANETSVTSHSDVHVPINESTTNARSSTFDATNGTTNATSPSTTGTTVTSSEHVDQLNTSSIGNATDDGSNNDAMSRTSNPDVSLDFNVSSENVIVSSENDTAASQNESLNSTDSINVNVLHPATTNSLNNETTMGTVPPTAHASSSPDHVISTSQPSHPVTSNFTDIMQSFSIDIVNVTSSPVVELNATTTGRSVDYVSTTLMSIDEVEYPANESQV